jgi:hypothetical protein
VTKPVTLPNVFGSQAGPIPLSQLDADYNVLAAAINDIATYGNYYSDSGAVNALAITVAGPLTFTYTTGVWFDVLVGNTNTAAATLNVNGLGPKAIVDQSGAALLAGALVGGSAYRLVYDGTSFRMLSSTAIGGTFTGTLAGCTTSPTATFNWSRVGNQITLDCAGGLTGTSNSVNCSVSGVPGAIIPVRNPLLLCIVRNNGVDVVGSAVITGGAITLYNGLGSTPFTASGQKGLQLGLSLTYNLS